MKNLQFLSEASKILSSSLDYNTTLDSIADLVVTNIADFCIIDLLKEAGEIDRVTVKVADPKKQKLAQRMFNYPPDPKNKDAIYDTARRGRPILIVKATREWINNVSRIPGEHEVIRKLGLNSHIFVPLKSRGKVIGVLTIASSNKDFSYSRSDVVLVGELGARAGIAVDNARLYSEAQEAVRARDEFLSIASHELKTPLTSILLQLQTVLQKIRNNKSLYVKKDNYRSNIISMLESTEYQSKRLAKLINDLLNISLVSIGRLELQPERVNLSNIVEDVIRNSEIQFKNAGYKIHVKTDKEIIGRWDKVRIEQVIINLVSNAIKYGNKKPIDIIARKKNNHAELIVKDRGIGISSTHQKHIFERFKRAVSGVEYRGLGVGLYISKQIIETHKGKIELKSSIGKGSTFTVKLPLKI
ncbi:MAG: GAF domain-containing sensor histidine kinase [Candidatus Levybacteria bacterium]|nr:GAF domain-containing sensor histidine kinase [Candidatus Levybacteria bacterium]